MFRLLTILLLGAIGAGASILFVLSFALGAWGAGVFYALLAFIVWKLCKYGEVQ